MKNRSANRLSDKEFRQQWISVSAYFLAEKRQFAPGKALDDWLLAEQAFLAMLINRYLMQAYEDGALSVKGLQRLATSVGVEHAESMTQIVDLIRAIQSMCHHEPCFNFDPGHHCTVIQSCLWQSECKQLVAKWL